MEDIGERERKIIMSIDGKKIFLEKVKSSLGCSEADDKRRLNIFSVSKDDERVNLLEKINNRTEKERDELLNKLVERGKPLNIKVIPLKDLRAVSMAIAELVAQKEPEWGGRKSVVAWKHPLIEELNLSEVLSKQNVPVCMAELGNIDGKEAETKRGGLRKQVIDSYIGITSADFCLAETATLVMKTRPGQARSVSLVPSVHIAIIRKRQIIENLKELYTVLKLDPKEEKEGLTNCMMLISGPSKTADIELVMVHGAHGPYELYLYVSNE